MKEEITMSPFGRDGNKFSEQPRRPIDAPRHAAYKAPAPRRGSISWTISLIGIFLWSGFALISYMALDGLLGWLAASGDSVLATGRDVGTLVGADQAVGAVVDNVRSSGLWQQIVQLAQALLLPAGVVIWFLGAIVILILPRFIGFLVGLFRSRRYS
jgi:hypothetical protein